MGGHGAYLRGGPLGVEVVPGDDHGDELAGRSGEAALALHSVGTVVPVRPGPFGCGQAPQPVRVTGLAAVALAASGAAATGIAALATGSVVGQAGRSALARRCTATCPGS